MCLIVIPLTWLRSAQVSAGAPSREDGPAYAAMGDVFISVGLLVGAVFLIILALRSRAAKASDPKDPHLL